jgi:hypothetical protein
MIPGARACSRHPAARHQPDTLTERRSPGDAPGLHEQAAAPPEGLANEAVVTEDWPYSAREVAPLPPAGRRRPHRPRLRPTMGRAGAGAIRVSYIGSEDQGREAISGLTL